MCNRRRRAKSIDCDAWYARTVRQRRRRLAAAQAQPARASVPLLAEDVEYWFRQFGGEQAFKELLQEETGRQRPTGEPSSADEQQEGPTGDEPKRLAAGPDTTANAYNPFPPGYAEDLEQ